MSKSRKYVDPGTHNLPNEVVSARLVQEDATKEFANVAAILDGEPETTRHVILDALMQRYGILVWCDEDD